MPKRKPAEKANWVHFRASTQLTDALDAQAVSAGVSRSELARVILETTLNNGTLAEIGTREGIFHFTGALRRAMASVTTDVGKLIEVAIARELAVVAETGDTSLSRLDQHATQKRVIRRAQLEHANPKRLVDPTGHNEPLEDVDDEDAALVRHLSSGGDEELGPGFGPG